MEHRPEHIPLLSVVIATRNRISYAISAIQSILEIPDPRLELVVQDNSDSRDLESYVRTNILNSRFHYRYTPPPFSMIDNFNAAIEMARGEYICLIGDDDGVNPEIMEAAAWAKSRDVDSIAVRHTISYFWPGVGSTLFSRAAGSALSVWDFCGEVKSADMEKEMWRLVRNGGLYYLTFNLPKLYHGLVHRRCLTAIHKKIGAYFGGLSPDIFASLAIACIAKRVMVTDYPLTIPGACPGSGSTYSQTGGFNRRLEDTFLWRDRGEYRWCELVPRVYTAETVWVDSGVAALRAMGRDDLVRQLNVPKLAAYCVWATRGLTWPVLRDLFRAMRIMGKNPVIGAIHFAWSLLTGPGAKFTSRVWNRLVLIIGTRGIHRIHGLVNMVQVSHALSHYLKDNGRKFSDCVSLSGLQAPRPELSERPHLGL